MDLPVMPPVAPMLAKPVPDLPEGPWSFEPKWDGFRTIVFRDGDEVELGSRKERPMTRYFPEVVEAVRANLPPRCVVDAELVVPDATGRRLDFDALLLRIHPAASRVALLATQTPARLVAFDLLALDQVDHMGQAFARRRAALEDALSGVETPVHLTPATTDRDLAAEWLGRFEGAGLDGLVAKALDGVYEPDRRVWRKVKHTRTADCVVGGYRLHKRGEDLVGSLLLGLYTQDGELAMAGVIGAFPMERRRELFAELQPLVTSFEGHPWDWGAWRREAEASGRAWRGSNSSRWNPGKELSFVPLRPERVVEVRYDHLEGRRFRHTAQFVRWRPDRDPASCTYDQLEETVSFDLAQVLATTATRPPTCRHSGQGLPQHAAVLWPAITPHRARSPWHAPGRQPGHSAYTNRGALPISCLHGDRAVGHWSSTGKEGGCGTRPSPGPIGTWSGRPAGWL